MKIEIDNSGVTLIREPGDKSIGKESTVTHHLRRLLNERNNRRTNDHKAGTWHRFYPDKVGLTGCRQGIWNGRKGVGQVAYWHERYAVENAAQEFNRGRVWFMRAEG